MRIFIYFLVIFLCVLLLIAYALCAIAYDADERANRMYKKWKETLNERSNSKDG